jgi:hypothetical protein
MFFVAGAIKLWTLSAGGEVIEDLPYLAVGPAGVGLAIVEIGIAAAVLVGRSAYRGLTAAFSLLSLFVIYVLFLEVTGGDSSSCGCLGATKLPLIPHMGLLLGFIAMIISSAFTLSAEGEGLSSAH